jgi:hypothetical protein
MAPFKVEKNNYMCKWHCKQEHMKFQTTYKKFNKLKMETINRIKEGILMMTSTKI